MCGGDLEVTSNLSVAECEFCGTQQTLPKSNGEVMQNLFNRANALRLKCEFDKAEQIYEKILQQNDAESEAHWGIVLCKYGIEYVEDPKTFKRIPTCHRTSYDAVTADADYLAAVEHADAIQRSIYEAEARAIDAIQKNILSIVKDENPFDVFICYKETDESGKRTVDSSIANDIYHQLTLEGLKVFYAAITLEDKLGQEYEPYIFAALNSAKVMLVIGTNPQYFTAVWVKNEWSRFLKLMKSDHAKLLIPCYKDMDAYELPGEFAHLQAQDMSKIGFINDVVRGIKKVLNAEKKPEIVHETVTVQQAGSNVVALLKRGNMALEDSEWDKADQFFEEVLNQDAECVDAYLGKTLVQLRLSKLELLSTSARPFEKMPNYQRAMRFAKGDRLQQLKTFARENYEFLLKCGAEALEAGDWQSADEYYEKVLDIDPENATAYLGKLMAQLRVTKQEDLKDHDSPFDNSENYQKAVRFADDKLKSELTGCIEHINTRNKQARLERIYAQAKKAMVTGNSSLIYSEAAQLFESIIEYKDSAALAKECREKAETARKDFIYNSAMAKLNGDTLVPTSEYTLGIAIKEFQSIIDWKDAEEKVRLCREKIAEMKELEAIAEIEYSHQEAKRTFIRNNAIIFTSVIAVIIIAVIITFLTR
jgi:tetratricopeptide (TPR) repeat protein